MEQPKTPEGNKERGDLMFWHKSFGAFVFFTAPVRVLVRLGTKTPPHLPGPAIMQSLSSLSHLALYGGLLFMASSGVGMAYNSAKPIPFFFTELNLVREQPDGATAKQLYKLHKQVGYWWKFMVPLHVGAAGLHFVQGHRIFSRINPFL